MESIVFVKLGGSLLTDKSTPRTPRPAVIERVAKELARVWPTLQGRLVVGHGSGSFGHVAAQGTNLAASEGTADAEALSRTQHAAHQLHRRVLDAVREEGLPVMSFAPSSALVSEAGAPVSFQAEPVRRVLAVGGLPLTLGDVTLDRTRGGVICSTETILRELIRSLAADEMSVAAALWFGDTTGVYGGSGNHLDTIVPGAPADALTASGPSSAPDVTGGMRHRLETTLALAREGVPSLIASGEVEGRLERALQGRDVPGTWVLPEEGEDPLDQF